MTVLLTGGSGFIGSHMAAELMSQGIKFVVIDNLSNSDTSNLARLEKHYRQKVDFYPYDIRDERMLRSVFLQHHIDSIIHFAALKSVPESVRKPQLYHDNNVGGSKTLMAMAKEFHVKNFIFSSSATVYGDPQYLPIDEDHRIRASNPYGQSKIDTENLLINDNYFSADCSTKILRYFNPVGGHPDGLITEKPHGVPDNLMPYILGVASQKYPYLKVYGDDYPTPDGSAIRDYIHIMDLIDAHLLALNYDVRGIALFNVGTGRGVSVLEMLHAFEEANNMEVPFEVYPRRAGDACSVFADPKKIQQLLGWSAKRDLRSMCRDALQSGHREG